MATNIVCETCCLMQQVEKLEPGARAECCRCTSTDGYGNTATHRANIAASNKHQHFKTRFKQNH
jgi:hypothetical protein